MFRITSQAGRIRHLTNMHRVAIFERFQDDAMPFEECEPACMHRDPFVCSCHAYEDTDTPLEAIPMPGYCTDVIYVGCEVCGQVGTHMIIGDVVRCFDCLDAIVEPHHGHDTYPTNGPKGQAWRWCVDCEQVYET